MQIVYKKIEDLIPYVNNPRKNDAAVDAVASSIKNFGFKVPIIIDKNNEIVAGHTRFKASLKLGIEEVPCIVADDLNENQIKAFRLADNKVSELADWDDELLWNEIQLITDVDLGEFGFNIDDLDERLNPREVVEDDYDVILPAEPKTQRGDVYQLGEHRLMCGDSTNKEDIEKLMNGTVADLVFTDPPYGMKKETVLNDNLNLTDLLEFNKQWIPLSFEFLKDNGSWYCWGIDEPLMDIYSEILKPMVREQKATFRNLITWSKGVGQGQMASEFRSYVIADEKCLFMMAGVQGFNTNADNYFEGWEPIRQYLLQGRLEMGWDVPTMKKVVGHSDLSRDHWTSKSQWNLPTKEVYEKLQEAAKGHDTAFKREFDEIKREFYSTRAYFDNTHDNMNNVWEFKRVAGLERKMLGNHETPKPIELCARGIKSSSREEELVLDLFGGTGSTLIAAEQLNRKCYMMELDEKYIDVIIDRWEKFTGKEAIKIIEGESK